MGAFFSDFNLGYAMDKKARRPKPPPLLTLMLR
jgi:hypothetical protein